MGCNLHVSKRLDHRDKSLVKRVVRKAANRGRGKGLTVFAVNNPREASRFSNGREREARVQLERVLLGEGMTAGTSRLWWRKVRDKRSETRCVKRKQLSGVIQETPLPFAKWFRKACSLSPGKWRRGGEPRRKGSGRTCCTKLSSGAPGERSDPPRENPRRSL